MTLQPDQFLEISVSQVLPKSELSLMAATFQEKALLHFCVKFLQYLRISKSNDDREAE